jgi:hypothetical protein
MSKYLIESGGHYYTIEQGVLSDKGTTLNAQLFSDYGLDNAPDWSDYSSLTNPSVYCWDATTEKSLTATVDGIPSSQVVYSQNIDMTDPTITGIDSVDITSDSNTLFAMSFDDGSSWWNYVNNQWVLLNTDTAGQVKEDVEAIGTSTWGQKATTGYIKFRFVLLDETCYVTRIQINYTN